MKVKMHLGKLICLVLSCWALDSYFISLGAEIWQVCIFAILYNLLWPWKWLETEPLEGEPIPIEIDKEDTKK